MLHSSSADHASPADRAACREAIRHGSRTFYAASLLLPSWLRDPAYGLYAFCRLSDDAVDVDGGAANTLSVLQARLDRVYHGRPDPVPAERALADIVRRYAIPQALPEALLEGLAWDVNGRRYETLDDLHAYAARVAGTVGVMMSLLMGARAPAILARACDLGLAMQLTNIARDVGEDARAGRIYLPLQWLAEEGVEPDAWLSRPVITPALRRVIARLLAAADELYRRSEAGIPSLPLSCRPGMFAARYMYAEIGREVERQDLDSVSSRAKVSSSRKAALLGRSLVSSAVTYAAPAGEPVPAAAFLIDAVSAHPAPVVDAIPPRALARLDGKVGRVLDLFERLERREKLGIAG